MHNDDISYYSWALCYEYRGIFHMRGQVSEVVLLTQLARKLYLTFILLVPPIITSILVIIISIFILIPTLTIIFLFILIPSRLLVALLVR